MHIEYQKVTEKVPKENTFHVQLIIMTNAVHISKS